MRILLADDHRIVRSGLIQILREHLQETTIDEASDGEQVMLLLDLNRYDLVILDITMPGVSGLDVLKQMALEYPKLPVLVLSMHPEEQYALRTLRAGAAGYLTKDSAPDQLIAAIKKVMSGGKYISEFLGERLAWYLTSTRRQPGYETLSDREYEVMLRIAQGQRTTEIAVEMRLSVKTISTYRARILKKMGMHSTADIVRYAIENNLLY